MTGKTLTVNWWYRLAFVVCNITNTIGQIGIDHVTEMWFHFISFHFILFFCVHFGFVAVLFHQNQQKSSSVYIHLYCGLEWSEATHIWHIRNANSAIFLKYISIYARYYFAVYIDINIQSILFSTMLLFHSINAFECKAFELWIGIPNRNLSSSSILWANSCCANGSSFLEWMSMFCAPMLINLECFEPCRN